MSCKWLADRQHQRTAEKGFATRTAERLPEAAASTQQLREWLRSAGELEHDEEVLHRELVLGALSQLLRQWVQSVALATHLPAIVADTFAGSLYPYGDHTLGVYHRHDVLDAICIAPRHVNRRDFFQSFYKLLDRHPLVRDLRAEEDARVPAIKMSFYGVKIRLVFARLLLKEIPLSLELSDDMLLKNLDERCVRSLNGLRVTEEILDRVPDLDNFSFTLQVIKLWAKRRGIYSSKLGFLGGESWAVLVARICQQYPTALPATLVHKFFQWFNQWQWPQPVMFEQTNSVDLGFPVWDPQENLLDLCHLMPIITPTYPQQNSASNVSASTRAVIMEEIRIGLETVEGVMGGTCSWGQLFQHDDYFSRYQHHVLLEARAASSKELLPWSELIEENIRHLVETLELHEQVKIAHVNPKSYNCLPLNTVDVDGHPIDLPPGAFDPMCSMWFIGLVLERSSPTVELTRAISSFTAAVRHQAASMSVLRESMTLEAHHVRREQLLRYLSPSSLGRKRASSATERTHAAPAPCGTKHSRPTHTTPVEANLLPPTCDEHPSPNKMPRQDKSAPSPLTTADKYRQRYERWRNSYGLFQFGLH